MNKKTSTENKIRKLDTMDDDLSVVSLYADGGCTPNPGKGGYGYVLIHNPTGRIKEGNGGQDWTTNNRMEMMAIIEGLQQIKKQTSICILSDSLCVVNGISSWMPQWKKHGWSMSHNTTKPPKNIDLWKRLDELTSLHVVVVKWVKGHSGNKWNERCDTLAMNYINGEVQK